jgi:hypothetical protein
LWHQKKSLWFYILDLICLHTLSFLISFQNVNSNIVWVSLPFHIADILFYYFHHKLWLFSSIGYDTTIVFLYYKQDFLWLLGWFLIALLITRQTFGHGPTQTIIHTIISLLIYML